MSKRCWRDLELALRPWFPGHAEAAHTAASHTTDHSLRSRRGRGGMKGATLQGRECMHAEHNFIESRTE